MTATPLPAPATDRQDHIRNFLAGHGWGEASIHPLPGDASFRRYIRVRAAGRSAMLMDAPPGREDVGPYVEVARFLRETGYSAPEILAADAASGFVLAEDLGDALFTRTLTEARNVREDSLYDAAIDVLSAWHSSEALSKEAGGAALGDYNEEAYMREVELFTQWFLPAALGEAKAAELREEYLALWQNILRKAKLACTRFVHRDFHADNLLWLPERGDNGRVGLLDFQDALWGHPAYDIVSLLEDARRDVPHPLAERCIQRYLSATRTTGIKQERFLEAYSLLGAQRNSKIIGIFTRLSRRDGKHAYLAHLPRVWRYLERDLLHPKLEVMKAWLDTHVPPESRGTLPVHN